MAESSKTAKALGISINVPKGESTAIGSGIEKRSLSPAGHLETLKPSAAPKESPAAVDAGSPKPTDQSTGRKN
jgi:hypothetical protein